MPRYVKKSLKLFGYKNPTKWQDASFPYTWPDYGTKKQYIKKPSTTSTLNQKSIQFIHHVCQNSEYKGPRGTTVFMY